MCWSKASVQRLGGTSIQGVKVQRLMDVCDIGLRAYAAYIGIHLAPQGLTSELSLYCCLPVLRS